MNKHAILTWSIAAVLGLCAVNLQASTILSENFDGVNGPFTSEYCGTTSSGYNCYHNVNVGVPTTTQLVPNDASGIADGADNDWYAAVFEADDDGYIDSDVGVQKIGGNGNNTHVGLVKDDTGILIKIDTTGLTDIQLGFDWRTFVAATGDELVAGYFVGDLLAGHPNGFNSYREINLSNTANGSSAAGGASDGDWNWNPINGGGNTGNWNEVHRGDATDTWTSEAYSLNLAGDQSEVWIAFWLDNGNHDIGKIDNITVSGTAVIPAPAAIWLFGSGLLGLACIRRRKTS